MILYMNQNAISSYFSRSGHKATLNNMMYNFYTRRITSYKMFLWKLFPTSEAFTKEKDTLFQISKKRKVSMKAYRRAIKASNNTNLVSNATISSASDRRIKDEIQTYNTSMIDDVTGISYVSYILQLINRLIL